MVAESLGLVADEDDGRWFGCYLGGIVDLRAFELVQRWFVPFECGFDELVEHARGDPLFGLFEEHLRVVQKSLHVFTGLSGDERDGAVCHGREVFADVFHPAFGGDKASEFVPFVDDEDTRFEFVVDVVSELFIDFAHRFGAIEEEQYDISAADAALRAMQTVPIDVCFDAFVAP